MRVAEPHFLDAVPAAAAAAAAPEVTPLFVCCPDPDAPAAPSLAATKAPSPAGRGGDGAGGQGAGGGAVAAISAGSWGVFYRGHLIVAMPTTPQYATASPCLQVVHGAWEA